MKKSELLKKLSALGFDKNEYWVSAGGSLLLHGLREETGDLDLGCTSKLANELVEKGYPYTLTKDGRRNFSICEGVDVSELWLYDKVEFIDDIPVVSLLGVYLLKKDLNREKDKKDLKVLEAILFSKK